MPESIREPPMPSTPSAPQVGARRRAACLAELAHGTERFHGPRREDCPWCGSRDLRTRFTASDPLQGRPGTFTVDRCQECAHVFQNPRLTPEGMAFHFRYPQPDPGRARRTRRRLRATARVMLPYGEPEGWLDVGTGDADFPAAAREFFPYTAFDGLDPSPRVLKAAEAERLDEAYVGRLTTRAVTGRLRARYDVVSLLHQLHHSPDPRADLHAALGLLRPGGRILIELPDPTSLFAPFLGRWWLPHTQPRHLHLIPPANLRAELEHHGCRILRTDRLHAPYDLSVATTLLLAHLLPSPDAPWRPIPPTEAQRALRTALAAATAPLTVAALAADHTLAPLLRHTGFSNTYRVIAQAPYRRRT
ncbi:class I SAM-dependent methyltransferase [Streptomyces sp. NPDC052773]|uniref:class I SAM-dependent methyltransferase n=1 Tax=Streptomyces sp. NPDC052773 TaxID=3365693 RepID=UPI0037D016CC